MPGATSRAEVRFRLIWHTFFFVCGNKSKYKCLFTKWGCLMLGNFMHHTNKSERKSERMRSGEMEGEEKKKPHLKKSNTTYCAHKFK